MNKHKYFTVIDGKSSIVWRKNRLIEFFMNGRWHVSALHSTALLNRISRDKARKIRPDAFR